MNTFLSYLALVLFIAAMLAGAWFSLPKDRRAAYKLAFWRKWISVGEWMPKIAGAGR